MLLSDETADRTSLTAEGNSHFTSALVSVEEFRGFIRKTGWRRGGYGSWPEMTAPDGTIAMSAADGQAKSKGNPAISSFSDIEGTEGTTTGVCWYDAFQFCRWARGRLPSYEELSASLTRVPQTCREWSSSWCQEPASWIAVARSVQCEESSKDVRVEMDGINPDLRFSDLGFRVIRPPSGPQSNRAAGREYSSRQRAATVIVCYARQDKELYTKFCRYLGELRNGGLINDLISCQIVPGQERESEIVQQLEETDIILLLVTSDFLSSEFIGSTEFARALERHHQGDGIVIPVILKPADWVAAGLNRLQALPANGRPISSWPDNGAGYVEAVQELCRSVESWRSSGG